MFGKKENVSLNRVRDTVWVREGSEKMKLHVDGDAMRMVAGLGQAQKQLQALNSESTENDTRDAALYFAQVLFGKEQAEKLLAFYYGDAGCVIRICGLAFEKSIGKKITKAQKKAK